ncbi:MAG TPA: hypothetical protein VKQ89_02230 [Candidatus Angelobacter sp.]|nr:hypothetical protein [Candidatus Angelobacter sp.]
MISLKNCIRLAVLLVTVSVVAYTSPGQEPGINAVQAKQYFDEARAICERDGGKLWGKSLCGPMLFVDPDTRLAVANQPDAEGLLTSDSGIFAGKLPPEINVANTAITWAGVHWTMIMWPLPESPTARARLMMHELFHRIQDDLGLPASSPSNAHLGTLEGRIWLQLEWRALQQALARADASPAERKRAVEDALLFRMQRRALFPRAADEERQLEMNEGLAEYTGYKLRGTADAATIAAIMSRLSTAESGEAFSRSFAYVSGPAYGMLLDLAGTPWRKGLTPKSDLGELLRHAYRITLPANLTAAAQQRAAIYDGTALRWLETRQQEQRNAVLNDYKQRLITGPVLVLPLGEKVQFGFNPNGVFPLDDNTTAYPTLRVSDTWGILEVTHGALMVREQGIFARVVVEAPKDADGKGGEIAQNGWKLTLAPGWQISKGKRPGDLTIEKK